jgi:hypothetical protein
VTFAVSHSSAIRLRIISRDHVFGPLLAFVHMTVELLHLDSDRADAAKCVFKGITSFVSFMCVQLCLWAANRMLTYGGCC